jgi:MFS family permease
MPEPDRPIAELVRDFSEQTSRLIRSEMELARAELTEKGTRAGLGIGMFGGAGAFGFWALGALTAAVILLLATAMKSWAAALVVCAALALVAAVLALTGRTKLKQAVPPVPSQATESVKEDVQWTKTRASQARR